MWILVKKGAISAVHELVRISSSCVRGIERFQVLKIDTAGSYEVRIERRPGEKVTPLFCHLIRSYVQSSRTWGTNDFFPGFTKSRLETENRQSVATRYLNNLRDSRGAEFLSAQKKSRALKLYRFAHSYKIAGTMKVRFTQVCTRFIL